MHHAFNQCFTNDFVKINAHRYPVWASLAQDYLSIIVSSVSSECAFSQGGITISKRRNHLKGDIVEALQCIKCAIRHDFLFHEAAPSSLNEITDEYEVEDSLGGEQDTECKEGWESLFLEEDEDNDDLESDVEID